MTAREQYGEVAVALPVFQTYTYALSPLATASAGVGRRVLVPFGNRRVTGYILGPATASCPSPVKPVEDLLDAEALFTGEMVPFFRWVADYYFYPIGEVIRSALPGGINVYEATTIGLTAAGVQALSQADMDLQSRRLLDWLRDHGPNTMRRLRRGCEAEVTRKRVGELVRRGWLQRSWSLQGARTRPKTARVVALAPAPAARRGLTPARRKIVKALQAAGEMTLKQLRAEAPSVGRLLRPMQREGLVTVEHRTLYRDPFGETIARDRTPVLTDEQAQAVASVRKHWKAGFRTYLLAGVTGSGKTEVYLQLVADALEGGETALVLVPEIALISQVERRFRARFGECVAVIHSGLTSGERYDQWRRILKGQAQVVIGARSAVFAPLSGVGLIVVDEEHDPSYKQETGLRYNARDLAVVRARLEDCVVVLGSATPSVQSYFNSRCAKFRLLQIPHRIQRRPLPKITVVDLSRRRDMRGVQRFITEELHRGITQALERREQVLIFLNRRGYASLPLCAACGQAFKCRNCDVALTWHQDANAYRCHYCGYTCSPQAKCPHCGADRIIPLGMGTQKVEAAVQALFPSARVARMDRDTTSRKNSVVRMLRELHRGDIDILIGTQMVVKGHDFPNITLVGIICADLSLNFPDFRAGERTFQLLAQAAGRAGRGNRPGRVILQTYNPQHFCITTAQAQDYGAFYDREIGFRRSLQYPPYTRMIQLRLSGRDPEQTRRRAEAVGACLRASQQRDCERFGRVVVLGPIESPLSRIARRYRWQILLKSPAAGAMHALVRRMLREGGGRLLKGRVRVVVDVDPFSTL